MSLDDALRTALGADDIVAELAELRAAVASVTRPPEFFTLDEVKRILRVGFDEIEAMEARGQLWRVELGTSTRRYPRACLDRLQLSPAEAAR